MIGFVIRKVILQQRDIFVDGVNESALLSKRMDQPDSTVAGGRVAISDFVSKPGGGHHGPRVVFGLVFLALIDSLLAFCDLSLRDFDPSLTSFGCTFSRALSLHSKSFSE
jgi:hypothetical protein